MAWIARSNAWSALFPPSGSCGDSTRLASQGMMVRETKSDATTVAMTAAGSERMYWPGPPGRKSSGTNASTSVAVAPTTATVICRVASIAASARGRPARRERVMFSTTTIESSTRSPSATTAPTIESWFTVKPVK